MTLYEATRHLHHACESHLLGQRMVNGEIRPQEWADWLVSMRVLHDAVDRLLPIHMHRAYGFLADAEFLRCIHGVIGRAPDAALRQAAILSHEPDLRGAAYVLHGAHRRGGQALRERMTAINLPTMHTYYERPKDVERMIVEWRGAVEMVEQAAGIFGCLLRCMDEIYSISPGT